MFSQRFFAFSVVVLMVSACSSPPKEQVRPIKSPAAVPAKFSQSYIDRLEALCYAQIQKAVGETRKGRGIIWAECMSENVRPIEKTNYPQKAAEIDAMYAALIKDMKGFYNGQTTRGLMQKRWAVRQKAIGYQKIRAFQDSYN